MTQAQLSTYQRWSILAGAAILLSLAMGMRQSFGLFQPSVIRDIGITTADFSLATAEKRHKNNKRAFQMNP